MRKLVVGDFFFVMFHEFFDFTDFIIVQFEKFETVLFEERKDLIKAWSVFRFVVPAHVDQFFSQTRKRTRNFRLISVTYLDDVDILHFASVQNEEQKDAKWIYVCLLILRLFLQNIERHELLCTCPERCALLFSRHQLIAIPKSLIRTCPSLPIKMFDGLMLRWISRHLWTYCSPSMIS